MAQRKQITLRVLPETDEKITRIAEEKALSKGIVVDDAVKKIKEAKPEDE